MPVSTKAFARPTIGIVRLYKTNAGKTLGVVRLTMQRNGSETWTDAAFATNNPCEVTVTPTTPNQPERILVRAVLLKINEPIGEPSDPTYVTVNP